eukprot:6200792-Pleurochrysis_carterae.AAC.1
MYMDKLYTKLQRRLLAVLHHIMGQSPLQIIVFNVRGNRHHVKHSCRSHASDRVAGDILYIPPSA